MKEKFSLDIVFVIPGLPFNGDTLETKSLGGSESAAIYMARELRALGHNVTVFSNCDETCPPGVYKGVTYRHISQAAGWVRTCEHDVLICQRDCRIFAAEAKSKLNTLWNHDLAMKPTRPLIHSVLWNLDWVTGLSDFHIEQQKEVFQLPNSVMWKTRNGVDFSEFVFDTNNKKPKQLIYSARPERGLENLVKPDGIMEKLYKIDPEIELVVAGYDHTTDEMRSYYEYLWKRIDELPNCHNAGALTKSELYKLFAQSAIYAYPSDFEEISCITAMECMRSKTAIVATDIGAMKETTGGNAILLDGPAKSEEYRDKFVEQIIHLIENPEERKSIASKAFIHSKNASWASVAEEWEEKFYNFFKKQTENKDRLIKHFKYYGDLAVASESPELELSRDLQKINNENFEKYGPKLESPDDCVEYADDLKLKFIDGYVKQDEIHTVLDFGCDIGEYTFYFAKQYKTKQFIGLDISDTKINKLEQLNDLSNVAFIQGDENTEPTNKYDCVIVNSVLEYQIDPTKFVNKIEKWVKEGGWILFITANGPWEKVSKTNIKRLWNFDRHDLRDLFSQKKGYAINAGTGGKVEKTGDDLSLYFISYKKDSTRKTGRINVNRKLTIQRPRHTVALSMITKNSEDLLHRALKSVKDIVDEIVIVDTGSTDSTKEIASKYTDKIYDGSDPLKEGFETPRNETLDHITTDWVLWIDSDEVLLRGENLRKYLRDNVYNGYALRQHHFSAVPPNAFKPDLPVRVFRTDRDIRWFGKIHEHVEIEINHSVKSSTLISNVDIGHDGYLTEDIRRKRFNRNYNLLLEDREKYPERRLGKFLKIRDDIHIVRYQLEENRGVITADILERCESVVKEIREGYLGVADHMQMDALSFYSEALRILGRGFTLTWNMSAAKEEPVPGNQHSFIFENQEDVKVFFNSKFSTMFEMFEGKYC